MRVLLLLLLVGCSLTPEQKERQQEMMYIDLENWAMCEQVYEKAGKPTWHFGHTHSRPLGGVVLRDALRSDLSTNKCHWILGDYWADYP